MQNIPTKLDHDNEFVAGAYALDFANTIGGRRERPSHDHLARYADLVEFARQAGLVTPRHASVLLARAAQDSDEALAVFERALRLREAIWDVFGRTDDHVRSRAVDAISEEAARAASRMQLVRKDKAYVFAWGSEDELDRVLWPIARSAADILTSDLERSAVHECESPTCSWLFLDRTRNHSRRWCDMRGCGNRAKARRFRKRRSRAAAD